MNLMLPKTYQGSWCLLGSYNAQGSALRSLGVWSWMRSGLWPQSCIACESYSPHVLYGTVDRGQDGKLWSQDTVQRLYSWSHSDPVDIPRPLKPYLSHPLFSSSDMHNYYVSLGREHLRALCHFCRQVSANEHSVIPPSPYQSMSRDRTSWPYRQINKDQFP